jgi:hypothetical protein
LMDRLAGEYLEGAEQNERDRGGNRLPVLIIPLVPSPETDW